MRQGQHAIARRFGDTGSASKTILFLHYDFPPCNLTQFNHVILCQLMLRFLCFLEDSSLDFQGFLRLLTEDQLCYEIAKMNVKLGGLYEMPRFPLGVIDKGKPEMPYDEDIEVMKKALLALEPADTNDNIGPAEVKLVGIKVFTAKDGKLYWVATGANSKKTA